MVNLKKFDYKKILLIILLSTAFLRLFRLDFPNNFVFDEVYHAFTAKEYLKGSKEAWDPWSKPPEGVAYEWTHPPLAKEIMTASMFLAGSQDGWAWRLPGVLFSTLSVYIVYLLGMKLLNNQSAALIAAFAFSLDGLNFAQSRIGMNDIYFVTFMLLSLLYFLNKRFFLSSILFGLSISSKWAAIYLLGMYLVIFMYVLTKQKDAVLKVPTQLIRVYGKTIIFFLVIPPAIYLASYIPYFLLSYNFEQFIQLQQQMWWYHTGLKATHPYTSPWWSWPMNLYPVWYFVDYKDNTIANIFASGNPAVFWVGAAAIILTAIEAVKKKSVNLFIILLGFFIFWLPWVLSPRIMFLYHFSPSVPFMCICLGHQLGKSLSDNKRKKLVFILLALMLLSFVIIYPFLTGIYLPKNMVDIFFSLNLAKNPF